MFFYITKNDLINTFAGLVAWIFVAVLIQRYLAPWLKKNVIDVPDLLIAGVSWAIAHLIQSALDRYLESELDRDDTDFNDNDELNAKKLLYFYGDNKSNSSKV